MLNSSNYFNYNDDDQRVIITAVIFINSDSDTESVCAHPPTGNVTRVFIIKEAWPLFEKPNNM